ncbi:hypothetical protein GBA52_015227 [Prunus armeniaca]|nr:hypothetical protein GBA52_015227 [Prunus armeniaca]
MLSGPEKSYHNLVVPRPPYRSCGYGLRQNSPSIPLAEAGSCSLRTQAHSCKTLKPNPKKCPSSSHINPAAPDCPKFSKSRPPYIENRPQLHRSLAAISSHTSNCLAMSYPGIGSVVARYYLPWAPLFALTVLFLGTHEQLPNRSPILGLL